MGASGRGMSSSLRTDLALDALEHALHDRQAEGVEGPHTSLKCEMPVLGAVDAIVQVCQYPVHVP
jgi:hypothetical protein